MKSPSSTAIRRAAHGVCVASLFATAIAIAAGAAQPYAAVATTIAASTPQASDADVWRLRARALTIPVLNVGAAQLLDSYAQARTGGATHEALDIMAPRGTPVLAVENGKIAKLFLSKPGGITIYQFDPAGEFTYYYAHLDRYAEGMKEGLSVSRGQTIGYVGSTGNASPDAPHLHFAVFRLGPDKQWWKGSPVNPYNALVAASR